MTTKPLCLLLLSGGVDSATTGAMLRDQGFDLVAMSFDYGQRHRIELECAEVVGKYLGVLEHRTVKIDLAAFGGSALTSDTEVPKDRPMDDSIPITYVPARNIIFLSFALAWAEVLGISDIALGINAVDYSGYPDCRPEFIEAFTDMANKGTQRGVEGKPYKFHSPLLMLKKEDILAEGIRLGLDYGLTTSCYDPSPTGRACGHCDSSQIRIAAFAKLGLEDPRLQPTS